MRPYLIAAAALISILILSLRVPGQFTNPQFWAEDGPFFWLSQYQLGFRSLLVPYAGALQTAPRLIAAGASFFDPAWAPRLFALGAILLTAWGAATVAAAVANPLMGFLMGSLLAAVPCAGDEILANPTNIQWVLAPVLGLLLASDGKSGPVASTNSALIAAIAALTGPFSIFLAPLALIRLRFRADAVSGVALAGGSIQSLMLIYNYPPKGAVTDGTLLHLSEVLIQHSMPSTTFHVLAGGALIALSIFVSEGRWLRLGLLWLVAGTLAATAFKFRHDPHVFDYADWSPRYFYPVQVCLWWCAVSLLFARQGRAAGAIWLTYSIVAYPSGYFQRPPLKDVRWSDSIREIGKTPLVVPVNPEGWKVQIPARTN